VITVPLQTPVAPPPFESPRFDGVQVFIVEGDKGTHMRHYLDLMTMLSQVGAIPGSPVRKRRHPTN
jgi:hypothetical protein